LSSKGVHSKRCVWVPSPVIIGAGPSGLAAAACLRRNGVPSVLLERSSGIASLWREKTYDRLKLHLPKQFCELPYMGFPAEFPDYPTRSQFVGYLESYAERFEIRPIFNQRVIAAEYDANLELWKVRTPETEYLSRWMVVATGENAEEFTPKIEGLEKFSGSVVHSSAYRNGENYRGRKVLVVGCGNSGMEVCLDLCNHGAVPSLVVRDRLHVLPREMLGFSTFGLSMWLMRWLPVRLVDRLVLTLSWLSIGDTSRLGLDRPQIGPLELKTRFGKTPVLDVGTMDKIRAGQIEVRPGIRRIVGEEWVEFEDGREEYFDDVVLATGYRSNVPSWLNEGGEEGGDAMFSTKDGLPNNPFPNGWKGDRGLYAVGFTRRGLLGASTDARKIADDIRRLW
ncbi:hypothetical protein M569_02353, partial [Genlisea aurea]